MVKIKILLSKLRNYSRKIFLKPYFKCISLLPGEGLLTLVDIGAADDIEPRWRGFQNKIYYIGFEPDERSWRDLSKKMKPHFGGFALFQEVLWSKSKLLTLYLCKGPQLSSVFVPVKAVVDRYLHSDRFDIVGKEEFAAKALDEILPSDCDVDIIKLDIQGAELEVLKGATANLKNTLALEAEVEFIELYSEQPLFGDVTSLLRRRGFEFVDFVSLTRFERKGLGNNGQAVCGDALYLRLPEQLDFEKISTKKISSYFFILLVYRRFELIEAAAELLPKNKKVQFDSFLREIERPQKFEKMVRFLCATVNKVLSFISENHKQSLHY